MREYLFKFKGRMENLHRIAREGVCSSEELTEVKRQKNTSYYIESYLSPSRRWNAGVCAKQRLHLIKYADVNWAVISNHIKGMSYRDFLATPYWKTVAAHTRYKAGYRCQLCNSGGFLSTHHRNYAIHGWEHAHMNELIVLCYNCHQKFHGVELPHKNSFFHRWTGGSLELSVEEKVNQGRAEDVIKAFVILFGLIGLLSFIFHLGK